MQKPRGDQVEIEKAKLAFFEEMKARGVFTEVDRGEIDRNFESAVEIAIAAKERMPSIGFCSPRQRINAFLSVCRHIDSLSIGDDYDVIHLALLILRVRDKAFQKAITMFEIRAQRFQVRDIAEMPHTARVHLSTIR